MSYHRNAELTPALPAGFVTLADVKAYLGVSDDAQNAKLTSMIDAASATSEAFCNTIFATRTVVETIQIEDDVSNIVLGYSPVSAVISLSCDVTAETSADFMLLRSNGFLRKADGSQCSAGFYTITYTAGFATLPEAVTLACKEFVRDLYNANGVNPLVKSDAVEGVGSTSFHAPGSYYVTGTTGARVPVAIAGMLGSYVRNFAP